MSARRTALLSFFCLLLISILISSHVMSSTNTHKLNLPPLSLASTNLDTDHQFLSSIKAITLPQLSLPSNQLNLECDIPFLQAIDAILCNLISQDIVEHIAIKTV